MQQDSEREADTETHLARVDALVLGLGALDAGLRYHHAAALRDSDRPTPGLLHHSTHQATAAVHHCHRARHETSYGA